MRETYICFVSKGAESFAGPIVAYFIEQGWQVYLKPWNGDSDLILIYGFNPKGES